MKLGGQATSLAAGNAIGQLLLAGVTLLVARETVPAEFGRAMSVVALGMTVTAVLDFGTSGQLVREFARGHYSPAEVSRRISGKVATVVMFALPVSVITFLVGAPSVYWLLLPVAIAAVVAQVARVPLQAAARGQLVALVLLADRTTVALATGVISVFGADPATALVWGFVAGPCVGAVLATSLTPPRWRVPYSGRLANPWRGAGGFGRFGLALSFQGLDLPALSLLVGSSAAGTYGAVQKWITPLNLLTSTATSSAIPFVARAGSNKEAARVLLALWPFYVLAGAASVGALLLAPWVTEVALGDAYKGAGRLLQVLSLCALIGVVAQPLAVLLLNRRADGFAARVTVLGVIVQFATLALLAGSVGATAAPLSLLAAQALMVLGYSAGVWRLLKNEMGDGTR